MQTPPVRTVYEFNEFRFDPVKRLLWRGGEPVHLLPKACELLHVLVAERGRVLEKDELLTRVWPDTIVEEANLSVTMSALRKALGESAQEHRFIVTIPRRGYRFIAEVSESADAETTIIVEEHSVARVVVEEEIETERARSAESRLLVPSPRRLVTPSSVAIAALSIALIAGAAYWWRERQSALRTSHSTFRTLAVLPFKPLVSDSRDEYLQLGMADVLITRLSNVQSLTVRPTSAVRRYAGAEQDALAAGRALQVEAVLDGNLQRAGDRVRVTARLLDTRDGATLWADTFDEKFTDIFRVQDELSGRLARALALKLTGAEQQQLAKHHTENAEAWQAYLKGRYFWTKWNNDGLQKAIEYFEQARALDPNYALAYAGLADAWNLLGYLNLMSPREAFPKAEAAVQQALKLDDSLGEAHLVLAKIKLFYQGDFAGYEQEFQRAQSLIPNSPDIYGMQGTYLTVIGKFDEAIAARQRALALDPLSPLFTVQVGWPYFYARRYDEAIGWYQKALELDPNFAQAHNDIGLCAALLGRYDQAVNEWLTGRSLSRVPTERIESLRQAYAAQGIQGFRQKDLEFTLEQMKQQRVRAWQVAGLYHALGNREQTFVWLEKAYEERDGLLPFLKVMPQYEDLHGDPRFAELLRRIGWTP